MKTKTIALLAVLLVAVAAGGSLGAAYAKGNETVASTAGTTGSSTISLQLTPVGIAGMLSGAIWAGIGYARARQKGDNFDPSNAAPTVIVGFIIGLIAQVVNLPIDQVSQWSLVQVITIVVDKIFLSTQKKPATTAPANPPGT